MTRWEIEDELNSIEYDLRHNNEVIASAENKIAFYSECNAEAEARKAELNAALEALEIAEAKRREENDAMEDHMTGDLEDQLERLLP